VQKAFYPYLCLPDRAVIAVAPLLVIWFGYGMQTVIASAFVYHFSGDRQHALGILSTDRHCAICSGSTERRAMTLFKLRFPAAAADLHRLRVPRDWR